MGTKTKGMVIVRKHDVQQILGVLVAMMLMTTGVPPLLVLLLNSQTVIMSCWIAAIAGRGSRSSARPRRRRSRNSTNATLTV